MHEALVADLISGDRTRFTRGPHLTADFLHGAVEFAAQYARIEKLVLGGTSVVYSPSALGLNLALAGDMMRQAEDLAAAERERFELPEGPILDLDRLLEDQGIKLIPRAFPAGCAARGAFFFDGELGPCVLVDAAATPPRRDYVLAHQYGHFLADYEPYIKTICGDPDPAALADARELRAHHFALAFLMPRTELEGYREALGIEPAVPVTADLVRQLLVYFGTDAEIVLWRLLSLGWIEPRGIETLLDQHAGLLDEIGYERIDVDERLAILGPIPERFIHLVASAFGKKLLQLEDAARYLGTDVVQAQQVLGQFHFETSPDRPAPSRAASPQSTPPSPN
jgi:Zn-dependent peptidase ImmA (M78 family)